MKILYDKDINTNILSNKKIGILGYGSQGHAHALNLRDSGLDVLVGLSEKSSSINKAKSQGLKVASLAEVVEEVDILTLALPDEVQKQVYEEQIQPKLHKWQTLLFLHGFNILYKQIIPPENTTVLMVAPKGIGTMVRQEYLIGRGVPCLVAVHQNPSGDGKEQVYAYAKAIGGGRAGILETTFKEETETDLFGEQVVLCGGLRALIEKGFETLVEAGYHSEVAYFECLHEIKLIVDLIYQEGLSGMRHFISNTAEYGDFTRGSRIITHETKKAMKKILLEIQSGQFAKEWLAENQNDNKRLKEMRTQSKEHEIEKIGKKLRCMMTHKKIIENI